jgi:hypothetical protein
VRRCIFVSSSFSRSLVPFRVAVEGDTREGDTSCLSTIDCPMTDPGYIGRSPMITDHAIPPRILRSSVRRSNQVACDEGTRGGWLHVADGVAAKRMPMHSAFADTSLIGPCSYFAATRPPVGTLPMWSGSWIGIAVTGGARSGEDGIFSMPSVGLLLTRK